MTAVTTAAPRSETGVWRAVLPQLAPFLGIFAVAMILPFVSNDYWALIGTRAAIYWVLVSGLNLVVGFAGHLAIGYVALLTLGAYTTSVLVAGNVMPPVPVFAALPIAGCVGAVFGVIVGLPALRLRTFYFAMSTLGFATIVTQIALAWQSVTGGGIGIVGPEFPAPINTAWGYYYLCVAFAAVCTWISANVVQRNTSKNRSSPLRTSCASGSLVICSARIEKSPGFARRLRKAPSIDASWVYA